MKKNSADNKKHKFSTCRVNERKLYMTAILSLTSSFVSVSVASRHSLPLSANLSQRELVSFWLRGIIAFRRANTLSRVFSVHFSYNCLCTVKNYEVFGRSKLLHVSVKLSLIKTSYSFRIQNATHFSELHTVFDILTTN